MESEMIMRTFDFCLKFGHLTLFSPHPPPLNLSTHRTKPIEIYFSLPNCLKPGVPEGRLDGFGRHDLQGSAISFELSFSDLFVLFCFVS